MLDIIIYKRDDRKTEARVGCIIGPTHDNRSFSEFRDYITWANGNSYKEFVIECKQCPNALLSADDYCGGWYHEAFERIWNKFEKIKVDYTSDQEDFSDDNIIIRSIENHNFSDDLDDSTKKEYVYRIMKVVSKLL